VLPTKAHKSHPPEDYNHMLAGTFCHTSLPADGLPGGARTSFSALLIDCKVQLVLFPTTIILR
jgi:hypothetical protein